MEFENKLLHGPCLDLLRELPDECIDSCVSDVPYGLGPKDPTPEQILDYLNGGELDTGGDFMGKRWAIPSVNVWKEIYRVLKPGGYVFVFGGTRTFDLISLGLRMAGFEYRDTVNNLKVELPNLAWTYGSGMPKSVDVQYNVSQKVGLCLSPDNASHVVLPPTLTPVQSEEGKASIAVGLARIQPEGVPVLLTGLGKGGVSSVQMAILLSESQGGTNSNIDWLCLSTWVDLLEPMKMSITEMEIIQIIGSKIWNLLVEQTISANITRRKKTRPNGCKCPALPVVSISSDGSMNREDIPMLSAPEGATLKDFVNRLKGTGSNLKPAWEPILLFRKPFKGTIVDNVLKHGTGALNIDVSRVKHASQKDLEDHKKQVDAVKAKGGKRGKSWKNSSDLSGAEDVKEGGRWPANLLMTHAPGCVHVGTKEENPSTESQSSTAEYGGGSQSIWQCVPGCPVAEMDAQSGNRPSTLTGRADPNQSHAHPGTEFNPNSTFLGERTHHSAVYADSGGASRFFKQFDGVPFRYIPKANRKDAGCGEFEVKHPTLKPVKLMQYLISLVTPPKVFVCPHYHDHKNREVVPRVQEPIHAQEEGAGYAEKNPRQTSEETTKTSKMPSLQRSDRSGRECSCCGSLMIEKPGIVLDPYCGSGSTCHAAYLEGFRYVGMERDKESWEEACRRMEIVHRIVDEERAVEDLYNEFMGFS